MWPRGHETTTETMHKRFSTKAIPIHLYALIALEKYTKCHTKSCTVSKKRSFYWVKKFSQICAARTHDPSMGTITHNFLKIQRPIFRWVYALHKKTDTYKTRERFLVDIKARSGRAV
jgi:hypothetical protein